MKNSKALETLKNISPLIGNTPLIELGFIYKGSQRRIFAKAESYNLTGSVKDRVAYYILKNAYEKGLIEPNDVICEATSGNTGIAFCAIGRLLGHKVLIFMPDWMTKERMDMMKSYGAEVRLVSHEEGGFLGSIAMCEDFGKNGGVFLPRQFSNVENIEAQYSLTGTEIALQLEKLGLKADGVVAGVGTGGTIMGIGKKLREINPLCKVHPLEPLQSPILTTGYKTGSHKIQGISDEFIPDIVDLGWLDSVVSVSDTEAVAVARLISTELGLGVGISSGANFLGALEVQEKLGLESVVTTVFADDNKKYLSTDYSDPEILRQSEIGKLLTFTYIKVHSI